MRLQDRMPTPSNAGTALPSFPPLPILSRRSYARPAHPNPRLPAYAGADRKLRCQLVDCEPGGQRLQRHSHLVALNRAVLTGVAAQQHVVWKARDGEVCLQECGSSAVTGMQCGG